jgi:hypothetical protein
LTLLQTFGPADTIYSRSSLRHVSRSTLAFFLRPPCSLCLCGEIQSLKLCAFAALREIFFGFKGSGVALNAGRSGYFEDDDEDEDENDWLRRDGFTDLAHYPEIGGNNL